MKKGLYLLSLIVVSMVAVACGPASVNAADVKTAPQGGKNPDGTKSVDVKAQEAQK